VVPSNGNRQGARFIRQACSHTDIEALSVVK
jgi:hypothetical protein